jgi:hypothetical protein
MPASPPSAEELHARLKLMLDPLWVGISDGAQPTQDEKHAALANLQAHLMLMENELCAQAAFARLLDDLDEALRSAKQLERDDLVWMTVTAKDLLSRYHYELPIGAWRYHLSRRPEVQLLERLDENSVVLEVTTDVSGKRERVREVVVLGEEFCQVLRLTQIGDASIFIEYLPMQQEFEVRMPSEKRPSPLNP